MRSRSRTKRGKKKPILHAVGKEHHVRLHGRSRRESGTNAGFLHVEPLVMHAAGESSKSVLQRARAAGLAAP